LSSPLLCCLSFHLSPEWNAEGDISLRLQFVPISFLCTSKILLFPYGLHQARAVEINLVSGNPVSSKSN